MTLLATLKCRFFTQVWPWFRYCVLGAGIVGVLLLALLVYILFFATPDIGFEPDAYPPEGGWVQAPEPVFSWPAGDAAEFHFQLEAAGGDEVYSVRTTRSRVVLPYETLQPERDYRWRVFPLDEVGRPMEIPLVERGFRTAGVRRAETFWKPVTVYPSRLVVTPLEMVRPLALEVSHEGPFRVELPEALVFPDGEKLLTATGTVVLHFLFDQARASGNAGEWGTIRVWAGGRTVEVPLVPGVRPDESFVHGAAPRFDPYTGTPRFANFERSLLSHLTSGTCVGIALTVKLFFERVDFGSQHGLSGDFLSPTQLFNAVLTSSRVVVASSRNFRDLADKQPELVMDLMSALHFENLNPDHLTETLRALFSTNEAAHTEAVIWAGLKQGQLPLVAGFRVRGKVFKTFRDTTTLSLLDSGHAFLVYRGWRYGDTSAFAVYDPNFEYDRTRPRLTTLIFFGDGRTAYFVREHPEAELVRFLPLRTSSLFTFFALAGHGARRNLQRTGKALEGLYRMLTLE